MLENRIIITRDERKNSERLQEVDRKLFIMGLVSMLNDSFDERGNANA